VPAALGQYGFDQLLFPHIPLAKELDLDSVLLGQPFGVFLQSVVVGLGKPRIVEDAHLMGVEVGGHAFSKTNAGKGAKDENPVVAGENASDLMGMSFRQKGRGHSDIILRNLPRTDGTNRGDRPDREREERVTGRGTAGSAPWLDVLPVVERENAAPFSFSAIVNSCLVPATPG
jgi:hypothetical protein